MPESREISWRVTGKKQELGYCESQGGGNFRIGVSAKSIKATDTLMQTMAHEMCHVRCDLLGVKAAHGYEWKKLAKSVCRQHGWREELF